MNSIITDILIIGGGPATMVTAKTALENYPDKKITVIKKDEKSLVPCGIPYIFGPTLNSIEKDMISCDNNKHNNLNIIIDEVLNISIEYKTAKTKKNSIFYDKLVFATGSIPFVPDNFKKELSFENVYTIPKNYNSIHTMVSSLKTKKDIIIVGSGFIGVEIAEQLNDNNKNITLIGNKHILVGSFDEDIAIKAENILKDKGVHLQLGQHVKKIISKNSIASGVELEDGTIINSDAIILAVGYIPNTTLAENSGLKLTRHKGIWVDEYMRTKYKDIFAVGDCSGRRDFITREPSKVMLASTSTAEARVAALSLYSLQYLKGFNGTLAIFSTMVGDTVFASAGITEYRAKKEKIDYTVGYFEGINRHPSTIGDVSKQSIKLIALKNSGQIIGGQVTGSKEVGEIINMIGLIIETEISAHKILSLQVATQPLLTSAPTSYPLIKCAEQIITKKL